MKQSPERSDVGNFHVCAVDCGMSIFALHRLLSVGVIPSCSGRHGRYLAVRYIIQYAIVCSFYMWLAPTGSGPADLRRRFNLRENSMYTLVQ